VYLTSKSYKQALASLIKIKVKTPEMKEAHQRVAYFRGLELFNNLQFEEAIAALTLSINEMAFDKNLHALAIYWRAEAYYRLKKYDAAIGDFNTFLLTPGSYEMEEYSLSYYNMGYSYFKLKEYKKAISWFRKFTDKGDEVNQIKRGDAYIRIADCYFVSKQYSDAIEFYDEAVVLDTFDVDYALFQKGFSYGLLRQPNQKVAALSQLLETKPASAYAADALYERGRSLIDVDSVNAAIRDFGTLVAEHQNSSYLKKALLQLGLLHYNQEKYEEALRSYKRVVEDYPGTHEAANALLGIKNIYVDMNDVDQYFAYAEGKAGVQSISESEKDSLTYMSAEKVYMMSEWEKAVDKLSAYIGQFEKGKYQLHANYYLSDAYARLNMPDSALNGYLFVIGKPKNIFTERSMLNAALIQHDNSQYAKAYESYKLLENNAEVKANLLVARRGQLDCAFADSNFENAIEAGQRVLITQKVPEEVIRETRLVLGKSYRATNKNIQAITEFRILAQDLVSEEGAEAKYYVAQMLFEENKLEDAEAEINTFLSSGTSHYYWLAKSMILLADIYLQKEDAFQAKANLQGLINNYSNQEDGIVLEARRKLFGIVSEENEMFIESDSLETGSSIIRDTINTNAVDTLPGIE
jgi:TolA-binding protein